MRMSSEQRVSDRDLGRPFDGPWLANASRSQEALVPTGRAVVSCTAPFGVGGLGRHFKEVVGALERREQPVVRISGSEREPEPAGARRTRAILTRARLLSRRLAPRSPGASTRDFVVEFDRYAARQLPPGAHLIASNAQCRAQ